MPLTNSWEAKVNLMSSLYMKGAEDLTIRERLVLKTLERLGRIKLNASAEDVYFTVKKSQPPVSQYGEGGGIDFARRSLWDRAHHGWRGYNSTDLMYRHERMEMKGDVVIVKRYAEVMENIVESIRDNFGADFYVDGGASGNELKIEGLDTFCDYHSGNSLVTDLIAYPDDTYFGIKTNFGTGGTWESNLTATTTMPNAAIGYDWPEGQGPTQCDYWTPKLVNTGSTNWTGSTDWSDNCETILRRVLMWLTLTAGTSSSQLMCIMAGKMLTDVKDFFSARNRQLPPHKQSTDLGFPNVLNFEGLGLHMEFGVPADTGFVWNFDKTQFCSLASNLLFTEGPTYEIKDDAWLWLAGFYGNLRVKSPKYFAKLYPYATS